ncbi:hypothetical protein ETB97_005497 [Aspergillus alliaceus]|uniref:F-box domain-containing protein n=1 Tax=Petromyces alliaceus TaxID=209559 RepID=A0A8H6E338_PETAA|nr:hypothetical protein ETB97_005497 [Aspergillus burnettii]
MDSLSQEILLLIVPHLCHDPPNPNPQPWDSTSRLNIASYATISRPWQHAIERFTLASIHKYSSDLPTFHQIFTNPRRRRMLRRLTYEIDLPSYSTNRIHCFERRRESKANQVAFNQGIIDLAIELATWDKQSLELTLLASSPMDPGRRPGPENLDPKLGSDRWMHENIYLSVIDSESVDIPDLPCIRSLIIPNERRDIHPAAIGRLISAMPRLEKLRLDLNAPKPKNRSLQKDYRLALASALDSPSLSNLKSLYIYFEQSIPKNHSFPVQEHDPDYPSGDALNISIRNLCETSPFSHLHLEGWWPVSPALFAGRAPFPFLQNVKIEAALTTYDGRRFESDESSSDEDLDSNSSFNSEYEDYVREGREALLNGDEPYYMWRTKPEAGMFDRFREDMARAMRRMHCLRELSFSMGWNYHDDYAILLEYTDSMGDGEEAGCRVRLRPEARWEIPEGVMKLLGECVGGNVEVCVEPF